MLAEQLGSLIKEERARRGLKQSELAKSADVSRTVLSRLEQGEGPVQTDGVDRLFQALGVNPRIVESSATDDARKQARLEQRANLEQQCNRHLRLAIDLAANDEQASEAMIAKARARVELWRRKHSCSPFYIQRWSEILSLPPRRMAKAMASLGEWQDALFQNSPWSWAWN